MATNGASLIVDSSGRPLQQPNDPAWQPPRDPLAGVDLAAQAGVAHREIPIVTVGTGWDIAATRSALEQLVIGLFDYPSQLADSIAGDSRVQAAMASRIGGLLGRPVEFILPRKHADSDAAKECRAAFEDAWPTMAAKSFLAELQRYTVLLGFGVAQVLWDTSGEYAIPHPLFWNPRYAYWHYTDRCYIANTLDRQVRVKPGDGHWILHAPHGAYRGWMQGSIRAIAPWWLARHYALRDWARFSERHGQPMIKAMSPANGDPVLQASWRAALAMIGQETVIHLPQQVAPASSYNVELLEAKDLAHDGFRLLIEQCDNEITLALLFAGFVVAQIE